ncbi:MAG: hypothetical protein GX776_00150 [Oxalobacter sp.]|nr:hypothetical protein [Oxalobacter sp.]
MKYQKAGEATVVDAVQWFKEGDHPEVVKILVTPEGTVREDSIIYAAWEYAIGDMVTLVYAIETEEEGLLPVSPGDYIITSAPGEHLLCKPDVFESTYKPVAF